MSQIRSYVYYSFGHFILKSDEKSSLVGDYQYDLMTILNISLLFRPPCRSVVVAVRCSCFRCFQPGASCDGRLRYMVRCHFLQINTVIVRLRRSEAKFVKLFRLRLRSGQLQYIWLNCCCWSRDETSFLVCHFRVVQVQFQRPDSHQASHTQKKRY